MREEVRRRALEEPALALEELALARAALAALALAAILGGVGGAEGFDSAIGAARPVLHPRTAPWESGETLAPESTEPGQRVPLLAGAPLGEVVFVEPWRDFRGEPVTPGRYALRYALQPRLKEHAGADAIRDFAVLVPPDRVALAEPVAGGPSALAKRWAGGSGAASGPASREISTGAVRAASHGGGPAAAPTRHQAVMAIVPWTSATLPPETPLESGGLLIEYRAVGGLVLGFVVRGHAAPAEPF